MKPAAFAYDDPRTLPEALDLLALHGDGAKVLAGGQSLIPLLNFRLARPDRLIDVNRVEGLGHLERRSGALRIGALTRAVTLERSPLVGARWPLLTEAVRLVGHRQIRTRGTVGGSVAHADPSAELPAALAALDARFHVRSRGGARTLAPDDFFVTHLTTALAPEELLVGIEVPPLPPRAGTAFVEHARVHGDFAVAGVAAVLALARDGTCERAAITLAAAAPTPIRVPAAEAVLVGTRLAPADAGAAAERAAAAVDVPRAERPYRRALVAALVRRAVALAGRRAEEGA